MVLKEAPFPMDATPLSMRPPWTTPPTLVLLSRYNESDDNSILTVNYAGFTPILVEAIKELELRQQQEFDDVKELARRQSLKLFEAQEEVQYLKELAREQSSELGEARGEIESLKGLGRQQSSEFRQAQEEIKSLRELAGHLLQSHKDHQQQLNTILEMTAQ